MDEQHILDRREAWKGGKIDLRPQERYYISVDGWGTSSLMWCMKDRFNAHRIVATFVTFETVQCYTKQYNDEFEKKYSGGRLEGT